MTLVGNGNTVEGSQFLEDTGADLRLLVDPGLDGYRAASLERSLLAPYSPQGWVRAVGSFLRGHRGGRARGDAYQLGGMFVITPSQRTEFAFVSDSVYAQAPIEAAIDILRRLGRESSPRLTPQRSR